MKWLRSHIIRTWIIILVCSGLITMVVEPVDAARANKDFTNWLQSLAKKTHTSDLRHKLALLRKSKSNLNELIEQASQIVSHNNEDFNLPLHAAAPSNIQQILLVEWNQYQTGNDAMAGVLSVETAKPLIIPQQQKIFRGGFEALNVASVQISCKLYSKIISQAISRRIPYLIPLVSGIAIGAP